VLLETHGPQTQGVSVGEAPFPHECFHYRNAEGLSEVAESLACTAPCHPVTGEDDGISRLRNDLRCPLNLLVQRFSGEGLLRQERLKAQGRHGVRHILGEVKVGGPRLLRLGHLERLPHRLRHNLRADELRVPLHRRSEERDQVEVLMRLLMEPLGPCLRSDRHQRCPVHVGVGDTCEEIRRTWAEGRQANARLPGEPALDVGHEGRTLLVPRLEKMDLGIKEHVQHGEVLFARHAEHVFEPLVLKTTN